MALPTFKVIIAGGRDFNDYALLCERCDRLLALKRQSHSIVIVSGTAKGADCLGGVMPMREVTPFKGSDQIGSMTARLQGSSGTHRWQAWPTR